MRNLAILLSVFISHMCFGQDSLNMERVGQWNPPNMPIKSGVKFNDVWGFTASDGSEYAIIGNVDSILVVDVSDPTNPQRIFGYDGGNRTIWRDFKTHNGFMYAVCDNCNEGLHVFDMSGLPASPVTHVLSTTSFFNRAHNIYVDSISQRLYAAGTNTVDEGLVVIDISTPSTPTLLDNIHFDQEIGQPLLDFYVHDVYVRNDTAYCSHGYQGYHVWDMTDLNAIDELGHYDSPGYNHSSWNTDDGQYAYYAEEIPLGRPLAVMDLTNLGDPILDISLVTTFKDPISNSANNPTAHNPYVKNDTLYISYYEDGFKVYDLADPIDPELIAYYDTYADNGSVYTGYEGAWGTYPFFESGNLLVSDITYGLNILQVQECGSQTTYYKDADADGYGDPNEFVLSCSQPGGYVIDNTDCDDSSDEFNPNAVEICDGLDNDCDGDIDDADSDVVYSNFYYDFDKDGYGDPNIFVTACVAPDDYVGDNTDCDDNNNMVNPGFPEICDGIDNDCDGDIDGDDPDLTSIEWYEDFDQDGYGDFSVSLYQCAPPTGYSAFGGDCDDTNEFIHPGHVEICDNMDNDCNMMTDENCIELCDGVNLFITIITQNTYHALEEITSDAIISTGQNIDYKFGEEVTLLPDFQVELGSEFEVSNEECFDN